MDRGPGRQRPGRGRDRIREDADGSALTSAVRDRLWSTGRARRDLTVLVASPAPAVRDAWTRESVACGLNLVIASHGMLSHTSVDGPGHEEQAVARAQSLAVDEAHNFLNPSSARTQRLRSSRADHVLLFTATPINRGREDLLSLVNLLGADNFTDESLTVLDQLSRPGAAGDGSARPS